MSIERTQLCLERIDWKVPILGDRASTELEVTNVFKRDEGAFRNPEKADWGEDLPEAYVLGCLITLSDEICQGESRHEKIYG